MHMIFTHSPFDDLDIITFTDLSHQISDSMSDIIGQHLISIFGYPHQMHLQIVYCVATLAVFSFAHTPQFTKSLGLKPIVSTNVSEQ